MEKKIYRVEMMSISNYVAFSQGEQQCLPEYYDVEAETPEEALIVAECENPTYITIEGIEPKIVEEKRYTLNLEDDRFSRIIRFEKELKNVRRFLG